MRFVSGLRLWFGLRFLARWCYSLCWCVLREYGFVTGVVSCLLLWFLDVFGDLFVCFVWCGYCGCCFLLLRCAWLLFAVRAGDFGLLFAVSLLFAAGGVWVY